MRQQILPSKDKDCRSDKLLAAQQDVLILTRVLNKGFGQHFFATASVKRADRQHMAAFMFPSLIPWSGIRLQDLLRIQRDKLLKCDAINIGPVKLASAHLYFVDLLLLTSARLDPIDSRMASSAGYRKFSDVRSHHREIAKVQGFQKEAIRSCQHYQ